MIVYKITNAANGKGYVGCTVRSLAQRWADHRSSAKKRPEPLYRAMRKYGTKAFSIRVLLTVQTAEEMFAAEREWIAHEQTRSPSGYNVTDGGEGTLGWVPSKETRAKIAAASRATMTDPARRAHLSACAKAQWNDPVQRAQLERSFRGRTISAEHRKKLSRAMKDRYVSPETRAKLRAAFLGKPRPQHVIERLREVAVGRKHSAASRKKMSRQRTGKPKSEAWKASMRASHARRREART